MYDGSLRQQCSTKESVYASFKANSLLCDTERLMLWDYILKFKEQNKWCWTNISNIADALTRTSEPEVEGLRVSSNWTCAFVGREGGKQKANKANPACFPWLTLPQLTRSQHGWCTGWKAGVPLWSNKFQTPSTEKKKKNLRNYIEKLHQPGKSWELLKKMFSVNRVKNHGA